MGSSEDRLKTSTNLFSLELYQALRKDGENLIFSPIGLQILIAMTLEGADGKTANEIAKVLHHSKNDKEILEGYKAMINSLVHPYLETATRMYVENTLEIKKNFKSLTSEYFQSEINPQDFNNNPQGSRRDINKWAEEKTNHKIIDLLPQGSIDADAKLIMINAIYFYAQWKSKFEKKNTVEMNFYVTPKKTVTVNMMSTNKPLVFMENQKLDAKIVKLSFLDEAFSMIIILPNKMDGLPAMENKLKSVNLAEVISSHQYQTVNLMLPRFKIEKTIDVSDWLMQHTPIVFSDKANLSGITDGLLSISKVVQKAFIEVNEAGAEAAATTGIVVMPRSRTVAQEMKCDHPFFFQIIKDDLTLFRGALTEPEIEKRPSSKEKIPHL
ncbi:serpin B4 [Halyomorpha halys]|uniref:serpin B4 n=1 Tax=Halyomorpha halys TaxID=286706 RepID=UPI0006D4C818|nr:serpin B4 [Halyomorpha halys]KAE8574045.1 Putative serpin [Halyomorpha halys]